MDEDDDILCAEPLIDGKATPTTREACGMGAKGGGYQLGTRAWLENEAYAAPTPCIVMGARAGSEGARTRGGGGVAAGEENALLSTCMQLTHTCIRIALSAQVLDHPRAVASIQDDRNIMLRHVRSHFARELKPVAAGSSRI
eukprot:scaffold216813_cov31-Tisochrysis_lutea.AAC.9